MNFDQEPRAMVMADLTGLERASLFRDAAMVKRYHTNRVLRQQTNGEHSFNMLMLLLQVLPEASGNLLRAVVHHDLPELVTGDMPAVAKRASARAKLLMAELEQGTAPLYQDFPLTPYESAVLKWCDTMELVLFGLEELYMGNSYVIPVIVNGLTWTHGYKLAHDLNNAAGLRTRELYEQAREHAARLGVRNLPPQL